MLKPIIFPYKMGSQSAKLLSSKLDARRVYPNRNYRPRRNHLIINWGNGGYPNWWDIQHDSTEFLNLPAFVKIASNKLSAFIQMQDEVKIPKFTTDVNIAKNWIEEGGKVVCRTILNGNCGRGIIVAQNVEQLVSAPLYTKLTPKHKEYRVHVFQGKIIDFVQKKRRLNQEETVPYIRSHGNGWVFARQGVELPDDVAEESIKAVNTLGLDFGAVDIATTREGRVVVFEVNTAPGFDQNGSSCDKYVQAIMEACNE